MAELVVAPKRRSPKQDIDTLATQWDSLDRAVRGTKKWADGEPGRDIPGARMCADFVNGRQWAIEDLLARQRDKRPSITINRIKPIIQSAKGFFRNNQYELRYLPGTDGTGSQATAETLTKLSKGTDEECKTKWIDAQVFDDGLTTGRGYWDIRLSFTDNVLGRVDERALNPFRTHPDPEADAEDPRTWNEVTCEHWLTHDDIEHLYGRVANEIDPLVNYGIRRSPGALINSATDSSQLAPIGYFGQFGDLSESENMYYLGHSNGLQGVSFYEHFNALRRLFRVIDRQHYRRERVKRLVDPQTGQFKIIPPNWGKDRIARLMQYALAHGADLMIDESVQRMVRWTVTCLDVVLFDDWSPYETFTVVPFFPDFQRGLTRGLVHDLIHPQQEVNVKRSAQMHIMNLTSNPGWKWGKGVLDDENKETMRTRGSVPGVQIEFDVEKAKEAGVPSRIEMGSFPTGLERLEEKAGDDLEYIAGFNKAAMGQLDRVQSGRAIEARTRAAMVGLDPYFSSFAYSIELKGRKRLELYQGFYTERRVLMLTTDPDSPPETLEINALGAEGITNNVTEGNYNSVVDQVPISKSYQDAVFQEAMEIVEKIPGSIPVPDLIRMSSLPGKTALLAKAEEAAKNQPPSKEQLEAQTAQLTLQAKQAELEASGPVEARKAEIEERKLDLKQQELDQKYEVELLKVDVAAAAVQVKADAAAAEEMASSADRIIKLMIAGKQSEAQQEAAKIKGQADVTKTRLTGLSQQLQAHTERASQESAQAHERGMATEDRAHQMLEGERTRMHESGEAERGRAHQSGEADKDRQHKSTEGAADRDLKGNVAAAGALSKIHTTKVGADNRLAIAKAKPKPARTASSPKRRR